MGKMLGGDEEKDPDAAKKEEERQEALRQEEEERKAKYAKMEAEREAMRQGIRDKVSATRWAGPAPGAGLRGGATAGAGPPLPPCLPEQPPGGGPTAGAEERDGWGHRCCLSGLGPRRGARSPSGPWRPAPGPILMGGGHQVP